MPGSYKTQSLILKRTNFSEADRIITTFSKGYGKQKLLAKGIRKITSRKKGHLELFSLTSLQVAKTKSIHLITEAATIKNFSLLRRNLNRIRIAYLISELVDQLTAENQENDQVYDLLLNSLQTLDSSSASPDFIFDFEKQLLHFLGFGFPKPPLNRRNLESHIYSIIEKPLNSKKITTSSW